MIHSEDFSYKNTRSFLLRTIPDAAEHRRFSEAAVDDRRGWGRVSRVMKSIFPALLLVPTRRQSLSVLFIAPASQFQLNPALPFWINELLRTTSWPLTPAVYQMLVSWSSVSWHRLRSFNSHPAQKKQQLFLFFMFTGRSWKRNETMGSSSASLCTSSDTYEETQNPGNLTCKADYVGCKCWQRRRRRRFMLSINCKETENKSRLDGSPDVIIWWEHHLNILHT